MSASVSEGGTSTDARKLKAQEGWNSCGPTGSGKTYVCEDAFGFAALPGGNGNSDGSFNFAGNRGSWWSTSEGGASIAYYRYVYYYDYEGANWLSSSKYGLFSVRCVQD